MEGDIENEIFEFLKDFSFKLEEKEVIENKIEKEDLRNNFEAALITQHKESIDLKIIQDVEKDITGKKKNDYQYSNNKIRNSDKKQKLSSVFDKKISSPLTKLETEKGDILNSYNDELHCQVKERYLNKNSAKDIEIVLSNNNFFNFINSPLNLKFKGLLSKFESLKDKWTKFLEINAPEFKSFEDFTATPNQKVFSFVRIICEDDGKLNEKNLMIDFPELSFKVKLDVSDLQNIMLFPSQMLAIEGVFTEEDKDNKKFLAENIYRSPFVKINYEEENKEERKRAKKILPSNNYLIMAAAGPFTNPDSISYAQLFELLNEVQRIQPDVLILFGPFMDKKNTIIQEGIIEVKEDYFSYENFLEHLFFSISKELSNLPISIYVVPSTEDITNVFPIPQEPFSSVKKYQNLFYVSNPSDLIIDEEIFVTLLNSNIIDDLRNLSFFKMPISQNRIDPCLEAILNQMNLCPVWPPSNNVDLRKISALDLNERQTPNLIILPSKVGVGFAKLVNETLFVNPGYVSGTDTRTFALISVYDSSGIKFENKTRVDIIKLFVGEKKNFKV